MQDNIKIINEINQDDDTLKNKFLTFYTEHQLFGIPIADVVQIVGVQEIVAVPEFPNYAKGVINLRGTIIPIIDVRLRLKKEEKEYDEKTCIIVTNINDSYFGFIVDSVDEVAMISEDNISDPPKIGADYINKYITGIAKLQNNIVLLMNLKKMLSENELEEITNDINI